MKLKFFRGTTAGPSKKKKKKVNNNNLLEKTEVSLTAVTIES